MDTLAIISTLIDQVETAQTEQKQNSAQQIQQLIDATRAKGIEQLGETWTWLKECVKEKVYVKDDGRRVEIEWTLLPGKVEELQLAPIEISAGADRNGKQTKISVWRERSFSWDSFQYNQMAQALYKARERFATFKQEYIDQFIKDRVPLLEWWKNKNEAKALQAHRELVEALPDQRTDWDAKLNDWIKNRDVDRKADEENKAAQAQFDALVDAFKAQYGAYLQARQEALEHNEKALAPIQALLDVSFDAWQLTYALHARDEEGDSVVEQRTVWLTQPDPENGEYLCLDGRRVKFYNPVSIEKQTFKPSDELAGSYRKILVHGHYLYVSSKMDQKDVDAFIASCGLIPLPDEPAAPEDLDSYRVNQIKRSFRPELEYDPSF